MNLLQQRSFSQRFHLDIPLCLGLLVLCGLGLIVLYSASGGQSAVVFKQAIRIAIAFVLMLMVAQLSPGTIERYSLWFFLISIVMLLIVLWIGHTGKGAQRWLDMGFFRFQPSECIKLSVPMVMAWILADKTLPPNLVNIVIAGFIMAIPVALIIKQPDLGTALLVAVSGCSMLFIAGVRSWFILAFMAFCAICTPIFWYSDFMHDYQRQRILTLFNYAQDPLGDGYHIIQSMIAIGSGGAYGKGWLHGTQSHLDFLPERSTDFIFAVYCEEFGLVGVFFLFCIYIFIIGRGLYIAMSAQRTYEKLLATTLILTFFAYIFVNMGMVIGQLPVVGIPLPLISQGGSSIVSLMLAFGILMSIHTHRRVIPY